MGFRELARDHSFLVNEFKRLVTAHNTLHEECVRTRQFTTELLEAHLYFVNASLWQRFLWAVFGRVAGAPMRSKEDAMPTGPVTPGIASTPKPPKNVSVTRVAD